MTAIEELLAAADEIGHSTGCTWFDGPKHPCSCGATRLGDAADRVRAELAGGEMSDDQLAQTYLDARAAEIARPAEPGRLCEPHAKGLRAVEHAVRARINHKDA